MRVLAMALGFLALTVGPGWAADDTADRAEAAATRAEAAAERSEAAAARTEGAIDRLERAIDEFVRREEGRRRPALRRSR